MTVALVTGGGRGVGRTMATALASRFDVAVLSRTQRELEETSDAIERGGGRALWRTVDLRDRDAVPQVIADVERELGPISVLVNNAGAARAIGPAWTADVDTWWSDIETNLLPTYLCTRAVVPGMIERRKGTLINVASYVATRPSPYLTAYAAAKAAIANFTESLAASLAEFDVSAFTFTPGLFSTKLLDNLMSSEEGRRWLPDVGTGRLVTEQEVSRMVLFLASDAARALSGRFFHALDDVDAIERQATEIASDDLYALRLRRLDTR